MIRSLWKAGLAAGLVVALAASSARAGFNFQISAIGPGGTVGDGFKIQEQPNGTFTVVAPQGGTLVAPTTFTATDNTIKGTATIDGTDFTFTAHSNEDGANPNPAQVSANITSTNNSGSTQKFNYFVSDNPFPAPSGTMYLQATTHSFSDYTPGTVVFSNANIGGTAHTANTPPITGPNQTTKSSAVPVTINNPYSLSSVGGDIHLVSGATAHWVSIGSFSMPEPTGVLLGLLGLPCMGGLVGWVRRRRAEAVA